MSFTRWLLNMVSGQKTQLTEVTPQVQSKKKVFCHTHVIKFKPFRFVSCRKDYFCWKKPKYISVSFFLLIYGPSAKLTKINGEYFYNDTLTCKKSYTSRKRMYHLARVGELNVLLRPNLSGFISASSFQNSVQFSIFHGGHFCMAMWTTRHQPNLQKLFQESRRHVLNFLSYIVFLHVSSLTVLLKSLSAFINLLCFSWQLWILTTERFPPTFPHASQQSTKITKRESKSRH